MALFSGINVVSIEVPDLAEARRFYGEVLERGEPAYDIPDAGWLEWRLPGKPSDVAVTTAAPGWAPHHNVTVVFDVEDIQAARAALMARGVRCDEVVSIPGVVTYCSFYDPFGNRLQMVA